MKKLKIFLISLFPIALLLNFAASKFPQLVDTYYSQGINKYTIQILSKITGIFSFSLYEVCMYLVVFSIILFTMCIVFIIIKNPSTLIIFLKKSLINLICILSVSYFLFIILWGLNYNRTPLEKTLINEYNSSNSTNITSTDHSLDDLKKLYSYLIEKANNTRNLVQIENNIMKANSDYQGIVNRAHTGYNNISNILPSTFGNYSNPKAVKSSKIMCYTGIMGIYFPFTGEANINIAIPDIYIPSTVAHEMAHQRGFASEDEANFIAYLVSTNHPDIDFNYSGYILALNHTASALSKSDYDSYASLSQGISNDVKEDLKHNREFWQKYKGKIEQVSNNFNNSYLKANGIKEGTLSYGKMVDLLLTYYNLYGF